MSGTGFTDLYAYQSELTFDPLAFALAGVTEGAFLSGAGSTFFDAGAIDNTTGTVSFIFNTLIGPGAGVAGTGDLAELTFNVSPGFAASDSFAITNFMALDSSLNVIDVALRGITVSAVPEPSTLALALPGFGVCVSGARLKRGSRCTAEAAR